MPRIRGGREGNTLGKYIVSEGNHGRETKHTFRIIPSGVDDPSISRVLRKFKPGKPENEGVGRHGVVSGKKVGAHLLDERHEFLACQRPDVQAFSDHLELG